jgi:5-methyltetrahydropteroyltriglutamate--homocysteine methyltransferase
MTDRATDSLPLLPTSVVGSHGLPGWMYDALEQVEAGRFGPTDLSELYSDAVRLAVADQVEAGVDVITDGEMRRWKFVQGFYARMTGLESQGPLRKLGPEGYDSAPRYVAVDRVTVPHGLGIVEEFTFLRDLPGRRGRALKATCPGPATISIHIRERPSFYRSRLDLAAEFVPAINAELKALVAAGADFIQLDEPSYAIVGSTDAAVELFNRCVEGVDARIGLHICFGNLASRPRMERTYRPLFPAILDAHADELVFEFANREMREIELVGEIAAVKDVAVGLVDVKSFHVESPELVADRLRQVLRHAPAERVRIVPDCGFWAVPRWLAAAKLRAMVAGVALVRAELASSAPTTGSAKAPIEVPA